MPEDPVVQEVRRHRECNAERFEYNVRAIAEDARSRERDSDHPVHRPPNASEETRSLTGVGSGASAWTT